LSDWISDKAFGGSWDLGEYAIEELISFPIKRMIDETARREGVNLKDPRRFAATLFASTALGTVFGNILGPIGGILGGLMGHIIGRASKWDDEEKYCDKDDFDEELENKYELKWNAFAKSVEILKNHVTVDTWEELCRLLKQKAIYFKDKYYTTPVYKVYYEVEDGFLDIIKNVNYDAYINFLKIYK